MNKEIQVGDIVEVYWADGRIIKGIVVGKPQDAGYLWEVKVDNGNVYAINPNNLMFDYIVRKTET